MDMMLAFLRAVHCRTGVFALAAALATGPVLALTDEDAVAPYRHQIALCQEALVELDRQVNLRQAEYDAWAAWQRSLGEELARGEALFAMEHARALGIESAAVAAAPGLVPLGGDAAHVPRIGWGIFGFFEQRRDDTNRAIAEAEGAIARGETGMHVLSRGWLTGQSLDALIAADRQAMAVFRAAVDGGSYAIHFPALAWVNRTSLEVCIADQERLIGETMTLIAAGEYGVHLPHLGWVTRNGVQAQIDATLAELAGLEKAVAEGTLGIARDPRGWFNRQNLDTWTDANTTAQEGLQAQVAAGSFSHAFPGLGWITGVQIDALITDALNGIAGVDRLAMEGEYLVPGPGGWIGSRIAREQLSLPDCPRDRVVDHPCLAPDQRPHYLDVLRRVPLSVAADIRMREIEIERLEAYRAAIDSHAIPEQTRAEVEAAILGVLQAEFDAELALNRTRLQRRLDWLRTNLEQIP